MHQLFTRHRRPLDTTQRIIINEKNHHNVFTNRTLSCTFDWTGAHCRLYNWAETPIEAAEKIKNTLGKHISVVYISDFGVNSGSFSLLLLLIIIIFFLTGMHYKLTIVQNSSGNCTPWYEGANEILPPFPLLRDPKIHFFGTVHCELAPFVQKHTK